MNRLENVPRSQFLAKVAEATTPELESFLADVPDAEWWSDVVRSELASRA